MTRRISLLGCTALLLTGCQSLGRYPGETDAQCIRQQMAPPRSLTFEGAAYAGCVRVTQGLPFVGELAQPIPLDLRGAPDLQAQARAAGVPYTD